MYNVPVSIVDSRIDSIIIIGTETLSESCCVVSGFSFRNSYSSSDTIRDDDI